jgi:hypothetical protein
MAACLSITTYVFLLGLCIGDLGCNGHVPGFSPSTRDAEPAGVQHRFNKFHETHVDRLGKLVVDYHLVFGVCSRNGHHQQAVAMCRTRSEGAAGQAHAQTAPRPAPINHISAPCTPIHASGICSATVTSRHTAHWDMESARIHRGTDGHQRKPTRAAQR